VGVAGQVDPVDPQRLPSRRRGPLQHDRARPVRQHPAQELSVAVGVGGEAARLQAPAGQLGPDRDGHVVLAEPDRVHRALQRRHPGAAHPARGERLHRTAAEAAVDHRGEPGHEDVALGGPGGEHLDLGGGDAPGPQRGPDGLGGQLLIEHRRPAALADRVVPRGDAVGGQHPGPAAARPVTGLPEHRLDPVVADRLARQVRTAGGDIDVPAKTRHGRSLLDLAPRRGTLGPTMAGSRARRIGPRPPIAGTGNPDAPGYFRQPGRRVSRRGRAAPGSGG